MYASSHDTLWVISPSAVLSDLKHLNLCSYFEGSQLLQPLNIKSDKDIHSIRLYSLEGKEILLGNSKACNQFLLGNLSANVYVLKVTFMDGSIQLKDLPHNNFRNPQVTTFINRKKIQEIYLFGAEKNGNMIMRFFLILRMKKFSFFF